MTDKRNTPPFGRARSVAGDRDVLTPKHARDTNPYGVPVVPSSPVPRGEDFTTPITGVNLPPMIELGARVERARNESSANANAITSQLADHAGDIKALKTTVGDLRVDVAGMAGKLEVLPELVSTIRDSAERLEQRAHLTFTRTLDVDTAGKLAGVEVTKTERLVEVKATLARKEQVTKLIALVSTVAAIVLALVTAGRC